MPPLIPFPDVPNVAGVPALARSAINPVAILTNFAIADAVGLVQSIISPVWGVFDQGGNEVLFPDSFLGIEYKNSSRVSDYPVEKGAFASYNKVDTPWDIRVRMAIGGSNEARSVFIATTDSMLHSTDLFDIVTPEAVYISGTLDNVDYRRDAKNGVSLLTVDLYFTEIREKDALQFSATDANPIAADNTQSVSGASPISDGQVQPYAVTTPVVDVTTIQ